VSGTYLEENVPIAILYMPLVDTSNDINGIAGVHIELDGLSEIMERYDIGKTGVAYIINENGEVLAHPDYEEKVVKGYNSIENKVRGAELALEEEKGNGTNYRNDNR